VERNEGNEEGYEPHFQGFLSVSVVKVEVSRDVAGGLGSKSKKWKLVVGGT